MNRLKVIIAGALLIVGYVVLAPNYAAPTRISIKRAVENNLRQIAAAGEQALAESGKDSISYTEIESLHWFTYPIKSYDGEKYRHIIVARAKSVISATTLNHAVIEFMTKGVPDIPEKQSNNEPNKAVVPRRLLVTDHACACSAPSNRLAHLER